MTAVDYAFEKPTVAQLLNAGITDAFRYTGPPGWVKTITQAEYDELTGAGIRVWLVFEYGANDSAGGFNAGVANAHTAVQYAPTGYSGPIFFACDEDLRGTALASAVQYIRGASTAIGAGRTGDYGPGALCQATHDAGYATYHWQSASTSFNGNGSTLPITNVQQGGAGPLPGTDLDTILIPLDPPHPAQPPYEIGDGMTVVPVSFTTNADGWEAIDCTLPTGATPADVVSIMCDWASAYDTQSWQSCVGSVDYNGGGPGVARLVFKSTSPNAFFTARVFVAA